MNTFQTPRETARDPLVVGLVVGSTRAGRFADVPARWIAEGAAARPDLRLEVLDLRDFPLPLLGEPAVNAEAAEAAERWRAAVDACDGYVVTAAEYNHGPSAVLKNALDSASEEWARKPVAFVGYGGVGGARAVEQLRLIAVELQMAPVRTAVHVGGEAFVGASRDRRSLASYPHLEKSRDAMFDQLVWWARALRAARGPASVAA